MSINRNSKISKLVATAVGFTMALSMVFSPVTAGAQTSAELQAQISGLLATIQALQAQLANMGGAGASCSFTFTSNLTVGSTGAEVMNLQKFLNMSADTQVAVSGAGSPGMETSYFGPATRAAVIKFQNKYAASVLVPVGLTSGTGFWGASSRAKANALCSAVVPPVVVPGTPSGPLAGTDGSINDVNEISSYNNEEVGEGESDVKILGMEVETTNDGDIALKSMRVSFDPTGNTGSDNLDDYIDSVSVWMGSTKIGSADVEDFSQNSSDVYERTITLTNAVIRADESEDFFIAVDAVNGFDSSDISGDSWTVNVENVRFEDGSGVVTTDSTTGDLPDLDVPVNFVDFSTAADIELNFSSSSDSPEAQVVVVSDTDTTDDVVLLVGEIELEGESDVVLDELPITFATSTDVFSDVVNSVTLKIGGETYTESVSSISAGSTGTITFDNLDLTIEAGDTIEFEVLADINDADDFTAGASVTASFTASNREMVEAEDEAGDELATGEKTGTVSGEAQTFRVEGINVTLVSAEDDLNTNAGADNDTATFTIKYTVEAVGDDVYVSSLTTSAGLTYVVDRSGTATTGGVSAVLVNNEGGTDDDLTAVGNYLIEEGEEHSFTLTISVAPGQDGLYRAALTAIAWDTDDDASPDNSHTTGLDDFETDYAALD